MTALMAMISLGETCEHVGELVRFTAAVQQITKGKRALIGRQQVRPYHVLHVGDATRQFFKVTCWGEVPPMLIHSTSHSGSDGYSDPMQLSANDAALRVGDIVLFSSCRVKSYRGNVEAQFIQRNDETATSSTVQLLYRKDRYFSTQDVRLKDLYPMIEWYKQHCREFLVEEDGSTLTSTGPAKRRNRSKIKDLRENMVTSIICKLKRPQESGGKTSGSGGASELDGVLLCELLMYDTTRDVMTVNLWDQHAEKRFVARLLQHPAGIEIDGIVIGVQALSNRLVANTTPHTTFRLIEASDPEAIQLEKNITGIISAQGVAASCGEPSRCGTIEDIDASTTEGPIILENVRVEQICLGRHFGSASKMLPKFAPLLAESYCTGCGRTLPELPRQSNNVKLSYGACENQCKTRRSSTTDAPHGWRYRPISMILRDARNDRRQVQVEDKAIVDMVGNIEAQLLVESPDNNVFDVPSAVTSLLNAFVEDADQIFDAQLLCSPVQLKPQSLSFSQTSDHFQDGNESQQRVDQRTFTLISLLPASGDTFPI